MSKGYVLVTKSDDSPKKAKVNWYRDGKLGISYVAGTGDDEYDRGSQGQVLCDVVREDQVEFKFGEILPDSEKKDVRKMRDEGTLRDRLHQIREEARKLSSQKRKKTRKKNKKRKKNKPKSADEIVNTLSKEELDALKSLID